MASQVENVSALTGGGGGEGFLFRSCEEQDTKTASVLLKPTIIFLVLSVRIN
jgi:hypothetical protein